jgi:hypothetical protein
MPPRRFRSAVDLWLIVVLGIPSARFVWSHWVALSSGRAPSAGLLFTTVVFALVWYAVATIAYEVGDEALVIRVGPFRSRIPMHTIYELRPTRSILSAPAASLNRIEVVSSYARAVVSPRDRAGFVGAIKARVPSVRVGGGL